MASEPADARQADRASAPIATVEGAGPASTAATLTLNHEGIPDELKTLDRWVAFRLTPPKRPGEKQGKIPINPRTGGNASTTNDKTWASFERALTHARKAGLPGVGFVFNSDGICGVDLDKCRDLATGAITPEAQIIVDELSSYTEVSPSGCGLHVYVKAKLPPAGRRKSWVEIYESGRFFTVTGVRVPGTPAGIEERQAEIEAVHARHIAAKSTPKPEAPKQKAPSRLSDDALIEHASSAKNGEKFRALWAGLIDGYPSQSEADLALCCMLARWTGNDVGRMDRLFRSSGLMREKWDSPRGLGTYGSGTIASAIAGRSVPERDARYALALTDTGNAERLVKRFGDRLRYCYAWKKWLAWTGRHWKVDDSGTALGATKTVARSIYAEASRIEDDKAREELLGWAKASEKVDRRLAMVKLAASEKGIPVAVPVLDAHPDLLNLRNGTLDLKTFELRPHRQEDYITKLVDLEYFQKATCPTFLAFLERIVPDDEIRAYVQRLLGYGLTGDVSEQILAIAVGDGSNGKTTLASVTQDILGRDYAIQIAASLLIAKNQKQHPTELADLFGVRLAFGTETAKDDQLDEALVKQLTGGDPIRARRMGENFWQFNPTHKLVLLTNHMPRVTGREYAMWRRLHRIPFEVRIPERERDRRLLAKLKQEREGILAWMVQGCRDWRTRGLDAPESVLLREPERERTRTPAEEFVETHVERAPGVRTAAQALFSAYAAWSVERGEAPVTQMEFGLLLGREGHGKTKSHGVTVYVGTRLGEGWGPRGQSAAPAPSAPPREETGAGACPHSPHPSPDEPKPVARVVATAADHHRGTP